MSPICRYLTTCIGALPRAIVTVAITFSSPSSSTWTGLPVLRSTSESNHLVASSSGILVAVGSGSALRTAQEEISSLGVLKVHETTLHTAGEKHPICILHQRE